MPMSVNELRNSKVTTHEKTTRRPSVDNIPAIGHCPIKLRDILGRYVNKFGSSTYCSTGAIDPSESSIPGLEEDVFVEVLSDEHLHSVHQAVKMSSQVLVLTS